MSPKWCKCGGCKRMHTDVEKLCCNDYHPVTDRDIEMGEMLEQWSLLCITKHPHFSQFLDVSNLAYWISQYEESNPEYYAAMDENEQLRHVAYRRVINWLFGPLNMGERIPLPSCVVTRIRKEFPSLIGWYRGFRP